MIVSQFDKHPNIFEAEGKTENEIICYLKFGENDEERK